MKNKNLVIVILSIIAFALFIHNPVLASDQFNQIAQQKREEIKNTIQEQKAVREEAREQAGSRAGLLREFRLNNRVAIGSGEVIAVNGSTLTVLREGTEYIVLTDDKTQFRRRFWGKSSLSEIVKGHTVNVIGKWTDETKTTIQARLVRDISIQKRYGVFFGVVQSITSDGWVMTTINNKRENQTVTVVSTTKLVNRENVGIAQADIVVGHRVRVKGLWDRENNTVTEVTHVKDFNLPLRTTTTPEE